MTERRKKPGDDLLSLLISAQEDGQKLSEDELVSSAILLLNAGHEATVHQTGNAVHSILAQGGDPRRFFTSPEATAATVEECLRAAKADMTVRTALLEARFLLGERDLFDGFERRYEAEIVAGSAPAFVAAKLAERDARLKRSGNASRYLVEPNVKEGKGGLRDLNTLFWIGKYVYRVREARDLVGAGLFSPEELPLTPERFVLLVESVVPGLMFIRAQAPEIASDQAIVELFEGLAG